MDGHLARHVENGTMTAAIKTAAARRRLLVLPQQPLPQPLLALQSRAKLVRPITSLQSPRSQPSQAVLALTPTALYNGCRPTRALSL